MQEIQITKIEGIDVEFTNAINAANDRYELCQALNDACDALDENECGVIESLENAGYDYQTVFGLGIEDADGDAEWFRTVEDEE